MAAQNPNKHILLADEYFLQQHNICRRSLYTYILTRKAGDLHQLRVSIKKIKAILQMQQALQKKFDFEKHFEPYRNIFKHAGVIREELLHSNRLFKNILSKPIKNDNKQFIAGLNKEFKLAAPVYVTGITKTLPAIIDSLHKLERQEILPYCKKLEGRLKKQWSKADKKAEIHSFRAHLKQLLYCSHLLNQREKNRFLTSKKLKQIDKLQDTIGQWHDNVLLLDKILKEELKTKQPFLHALQQETKVLEKKVRKKAHKL